eukprot:gene8841-9576_t
MSKFWNDGKGIAAIASVVAASAVAGGYIYQQRRKSSQIDPDIRPEGRSKDITTKFLEFGSKLFQSNSPLQDTTIYLVGFHPMKHHPEHQMEAHHYCKQLNEDFAQCVLYDSNTNNANLIGLEYIISERLYDQLPAEERVYWHPHNYEILSGMLCAPGLPDIAEKELLKKKINSYGKTFHTWRAKCWEGEKPFLDTLPKGEAILAWSFNHDNQAKAEMFIHRDQTMEIDSYEKRQQREDLSQYTHPQGGVNYLKSKFPKTSTKTTPYGVVDIEDCKKK